MIIVKKCISSVFMGFEIDKMNIYIIDIMSTVEVFTSNVVIRE